MTKKQKKAINNLKEIIKLAEDEINKNNKDVTVILDITDLKSIKTILSMLEEQDKIIDLMAEMLNNYDIDEDICKQMGQKENCNEFTDKENCKACIKQYFENQIKEVE